MNLEDLGYNDAFASSFAPHEKQRRHPARVARADKHLYQVFLSADASPERAEVSGRMRHEALGPADFPAVGDWVAVAPPVGGTAVIHAVLPRATVFARTAPGRETVEQVVAANVDTVFLVGGLDGDFNPRRIERYLVAARESGAAPVVVLNKADVLLAADPARFAVRLTEVEEIAGGAPVHAVSALAGDGLAPLRAHLARGRTIALLGSSGVGKSTLVNALAGEARQATGAVREADDRGRHTTTHRELVRLGGGAWLIDTPGMRELALWGGDEGVSATFGDIEALAASCRFGDCAHGKEPGCAVQSALLDGALPEERYASWRKLEREARAFAARHDHRLRALERARARAFTKSVRDRPPRGMR
ncbi:MAG: ribosome small subunit-dependent GTPase A [Candidatus Eisenbacteria bacterium]